MKRILGFLFAIATIILGGSTAYAADLAAPPAYYPPPPPPIVYSWTGFYVGANGGFGGDRLQFPATVGPVPALGVTAPVSGTARLNSSGFFGGGQIGYNWQIAPAWVVGLESDFDAADIEGVASASAGSASASAGSKLDWFGTVRGRAGFLVTPNALLYGTGGWAFGHITTSANATAFGVTASTSVSNDKEGWTAGGGLEYAFNPWVSFKTEYLFLDFGTNTVASGTLAGVPFSFGEKTTAHTVKAGLNVKLGPWGTGWGWGQ